MRPYNYTVFHHMRAGEGSVTSDRREEIFIHLLILPEFRNAETALEESEELSYELTDTGHMIPRPAGRVVIPLSGKWRYEGDYFSSSELELIGSQIWHWLDLWN